MADYSRGKVYVMRNYVNKVLYVGSTIETLSKRMTKHRSAAKTGIKMLLYDEMRNLGIDQFYIELIENWPCETIEELKKREGHYMRKYDTVKNGYNKKLERGYTSSENYEAQKERFEDTPEAKAKYDAYQKQYREDEEHKAAKLESERKRLEKPEAKASKAVSQRKYMDKPEAKEVRRKTEEKRMEKPDVKAHREEYLKAYRDTDEYRAKNAEDQRQRRGGNRDEYNKKKREARAAKTMTDEEREKENAKQRERYAARQAAKAQAQTTQ